MPIPTPENEAQRLQALARYEILDTPEEESFDRITRLATSLFSAPIAVISLVDRDRVWFKSCIGNPLREAPRQDSFTAWVILSDSPLIIPDANEDPRFRESPLVTGQTTWIRFYAGTPLITPDGFRIGALSILDTEPRPGLTAEQTSNLAGLARLIIDQLELRVATIRLRASEAEYRNLFDNAPVGIYRTSPAGEILVANSTILRILNYPSLRELQARNLETDRLVKDREAWRRELEALGQITDYQGVWYDRLNHPVYVRETARAVRGGDGAVLYYEGWIEDLTAQRAAEAQREEARQFNQKLIAALPDLVAIRDLSLDRLVFYNLSYSEVLGQNPEIVEPREHGWTELIHPDDLSRVQEHRQQCREANDHETLEVEFRFRDQSGKYRLINCRESVFLRGPDGAATHLLGIFTNVSERRAMEDRLRRDEERWQLVIAANNDGLWDWDAVSDTVFFSPRWREMLGYAPGDPECPRAWEPLLHPDEVDRVKAALAAYLRRESPVYVQEYRLRAKDGSYRWVLARGIAQWDKDGKPKRMIGGHSDITQRKEAEFALQLQAQELAEARDKAEAAVDAKSTFLATMSHEIRTPLNGILGMTGILSGTELTPSQQDYLRTIRSSGSALLAVVNDILDFSKIEAGRMELEEVDFDLRAVLEESLDLVAEAASRKGLELIPAIDRGIPARVRGDAGRLRQVILNLLTNAVKFTLQGEIVLSANLVKQAGSSTVLRFAVSDTGIGMPPDVCARVFDPFSQADSSTTRRFGGTGLGLTISKQLVELMNGKIGLKSTEGVGSTFWVEILFRHASPADEESGFDLRGSRILVADDNETNLRILQTLLEGLGTTVVSAVDGISALSALLESAKSKKKIDVALLDYQMPLMDGLMLARAIRAQRQFQDLPIMMLTSVTQRDQLQEIKEVDLQGCLIKPLRYGQLIGSIRALLAPKAKVEAEAAVSPPPPAKPAGPDQARHVLLAEDHPVNQKVGLLLLKRLGYLVDVVSNGKEAVEAVSKVPYHAILLDCQMPVMDGFEATRAIRRLEGPQRRIPIIALTANSLAGERERCLDAGMDDYLPKPINQEILAEKLSLWVPPPIGPLAQ